MARLLPNGTVHYYFADQVGSATVITNNVGLIKEDSDYYPYGGERVIVDTLANNYKFTGKERDLETGDDYFGARYYASSIGRWMSPDWSAKQEPVPYSKLDNPQTLNLYSYVQNNPLSNVDDDGHATIELRYTPVAVGNHTYIVVTDTNGHQTYYRAGPTNGASSGWITPASSGSSTQGAGSNSSNSSNSTTPGAGPGGAGANTGPFGALTANHETTSLGPSITRRILRPV